MTRVRTRVWFCFRTRLCLGSWNSVCSLVCLKTGVPSVRVCCQISSSSVSRGYTQCSLCRLTALKKCSALSLSW